MAGIVGVFVQLCNIRERVLVGVFDCVTNVSACARPRTYRAVACVGLRSNRQTPSLTHIRLLRSLGKYRAIHTAHRLGAVRGRFIMVARYPCGVECWLMHITHKAECSSISYHHNRVRAKSTITTRIRIRNRATRNAIGSHAK